MLLYTAYNWTLNRPLVMHSQIWNVKHKKTKISNMDIGFNQSEPQISLCSRFALHNKTNIKCSPLPTKRKALGIRVIKFLILLFIRHVRVINRFSCAPLGIVNTYCVVMTFFSNKYWIFTNYYIEIYILLIFIRSESCKSLTVNIA